jgi:glycosyltransferase involved in cell wall biosynthesis
MLLENDFKNDVRVEKEVQTLFSAGHEIIVAGITSSDLTFEERRENCLVLRKNISKLIYRSSVGALKFPLYFNFWRRYIKNILCNYKIDAIHVHDLPLGCIGREFSKKFKVKFVLDLHENWPALLAISTHTNTFLGKLLSSERQWREYEKLCVAQADAVIAVVDEMKERISHHGIPQEKIYILENTIEKGSVKDLKYKRDENILTLIYVGGISYHRGLQFAISGLKLLTEEIPIRLWIAGDGKYAAVLKDHVKNLKLQDHVEFFGILSKSEIVDLLIKANLGLIPHIRSEQSDSSSPNKLFEYMAFGLPVLASDCTSIKRVLDVTGAGTTYVFDSSSDFVSVVLDLYSHHEKLDIFALNGKKAIREMFNWEKSSVSLLNLYSNLGQSN